MGNCPVCHFDPAQCACNDNHADLYFSMLLAQVQRDAANDNTIRKSVRKREKRTIMVPPLEVFRSKSVVRRMAMVASSLPISRRGFADWMADRFMEEIEFASDCGWNFDLPEVDEVLAEGDAGTWYADLKTFATQPPKQVPQWRVLPRLRLFYLAIMIEYPALGAHILR